MYCRRMSTLVLHSPTPSTILPATTTTCTTTISSHFRYLHRASLPSAAQDERRQYCRVRRPRSELPSESHCIASRHYTTAESCTYNNNWIWTSTAAYQHHPACSNSNSERFRYCQATTNNTLYISTPRHPSRQYPAASAARNGIDIISSRQAGALPVAQPAPVPNYIHSLDHTTPTRPTCCDRQPRCPSSSSWHLCFCC